MDQPSVDFLEYIKKKNVKDDLTYLHLDDLRVALLLQALNKAESKADSIIDKKSRLHTSRQKPSKPRSAK